MCQLKSDILFGDGKCKNVLIKHRFLDCGLELVKQALSRRVFEDVVWLVPDEGDDAMQDDADEEVADHGPAKEGIKLK